MTVTVLDVLPEEPSWLAAEREEADRLAPWPEAVAGPEAPSDEPGSTSRFRPGGAFILDQPEAPDSLWGEDSEVAWAGGEPLYIVGPIGVGKTTLLQRVALHRLGILGGRLLGYPVEPADGRLLYLAADRPRQIARSFRRMVTETDRPTLDDRLVVWPGPPAADLAKSPEMLAQMVAEAGATEVYLDSLKDMAVGLATDEVGAGFNMSVQTAIAAGFEVIGAHHQRKQGQGTATRPKGLDDVYGSTWIASGAGSVILLWGEPGDTVLELVHLKPPADPVGPMKVILHVTTGVVSIDEEVDLVELAARATNGLAVEGAARALFGTEKPTKADTEKARRRLQKLTREGLLEEVKGASANGGTPPTLWRPVAR